MKVLEQVQVGNHSFKNRLMRAATWEALADSKGYMTDRLFNVYENLAKGGVGAIITGYAFVTEEEQPNPNMMGIYNDSFIEEYKELTKMVHSYDAKIFLQVAYGGANTGLTPPSNHIFGPSAVENEVTKITPYAMTKEDIEYVTQAFVNAGIRAEKAGFDGVELHGAHGYLLSLFLSPMFNTRNDVYGGSIENRARIIVDIVKRLRKEVSKEFLILIKINSEDFIPDNMGLTSEESILVTQMLEKAGLDMVEVSGGNASCAYVGKNNLAPARSKLRKDNESYFAEHTKKLVKAVNIPVILTGGNRTLTTLEDLYTSHQIDFFALSRPLLCEPDLVNIWKEKVKQNPEAVEKIRAKCVSCNGCFRTEDGKHCVIK